MKTFLGVLTLMVLVASSASAVPVDCSTVSSATGSKTLDAFVGLTDGCFDQDKLYTNFTYDPLSSGVADTDVQVAIGTVSLPSGIDQHSVNFQTAGWTSAFTLGFDISVLPAYPLVNITAVAFDITAPPSPVNPVNLSSATMDNSPDNDPAFQLLATALGGDVVFGLLSRSIGVEITGSPFDGSIQQVSTTFFQSAIPEPGTMLTLGIGLVGLGLYRRRS
jgi:hypothetical protein